MPQRTCSPGHGFVAELLLRSLDALDAVKGGHHAAVPHDRADGLVRPGAVALA